MNESNGQEHSFLYPLFLKNIFYLVHKLLINGKTVSIDEGPRKPDVEKIKSLDPAFDAEGSVTAATSSPISVGAAAAIIMSKEKAEKLNISPKFVGICSKATEYFPEDRFSTANEFAEALKKICLEMKGEV